MPYLKPNTRAVLWAIYEHQQNDPIPMSLREIRSVVGFSSTSVVQYHLDRLWGMDMIARRPGLARSILITEKGKEALGVDN